MRLRLVNLLGAIGYLFVLVQWMWMLLLIAVPLSSQPIFQELFMPKTQQIDSQPTEPRQALPGPVESIILVLSLLISVGIIIYAIVAVPKVVGRSGQKLTSQAAKRALPVVTKHKKLSKKRQLKLTERITWSLKLSIIVIPLIALIIPPSEVIELDHGISVVFGALLAVVAGVAFGLQLMLSKLWRIKTALVW